VRRDGKLKTIAAEIVVPGDIVLLESGDVVTADIRLVEARNLFCDESTLTGESIPVEKSMHAVSADAILAERTSMLHKGTAITRGIGEGVVVATGMATELGLTTRLVIETESETSPLERKLAELTRQLVIAVLIITALIAAAGMASGRDLMLMIEASHSRSPPFPRACRSWRPWRSRAACGAWQSETSWSSASPRSRRLVPPQSSAPTRPAPSPKIA
jgi:Ca2+-transporting ATPase